MRRNILLAVGATLALAASARAQVVVATPWVTVQVQRGAGVSVQTPWITVEVGGRMGIPGVAPPSRPMPPVAPKSKGEAAAVRRAPTVAEFATSFEPTAGPHEVELIHPGTGQPVKVAFTLPEGTPSKIRVRRRSLDFEYGRQDVSIRFLIGGRVQVRN
jgi:hypothetical protein